MESFSAHDCPAVQGNHWRKLFRLFDYPEAGAVSYTHLLIFAIGSVLSTNTDLVLLLYNPAVYETADVMATYVYRDSLLGGRFSFGTAVGLFTSCLLYTSSETLPRCHCHGLRSDSV